MQQKSLCIAGDRTEALVYQFNVCKEQRGVRSLWLPTSWSWQCRVQKQQVLHIKCETWSASVETFIYRLYMEYHFFIDINRQNPLIGLWVLYFQSLVRGGYLRGSLRPCRWCVRYIAKYEKHRAAQSWPASVDNFVSGGDFDFRFHGTRWRPYTKYKTRGLNSHHVSMLKIQKGTKKRRNLPVVIVFSQFSRPQA